MLASLAMFPDVLLLCEKCNVVFVFFFKHKTAYDMRISDGSSDVCSSDLIQPDARGMIAEQVIVAAGHVEDSPPEEGPDLGQAQAFHRIHHEIGRASCRERVCQYV